MSKVIPARPPASRSTVPPRSTAPATPSGSSDADRPVTDDGGTSTLRRVRRFVGGHQLSVFLVLAIVLAWWPWLLTPGDLNPTGPAIAAFIVVALSAGDPIRRFARQVVDVRVSPRWLAAAILVPAVVVIGSVAVNILLGAPAPTGAQLGLWTGLPLEFLLVLVLVGFGEEIGWTAFAAPRALAGRTVVVAFVVLSTIRALWHLPLVLSGDMPWVAVVGMVAFQFLVLWIYRRSGGQWVTAAVFHSVNNVLGGSFLFQMVDGQDLMRLFALQGSFYALLAVGAFIVDRRRSSVASADATGALSRKVIA